MVVIKKNAVGYGIYDEPYWYNGSLVEGLYCTAETIEKCEEYCKKNNIDYKIEK